MTTELPIIQKTYDLIRWYVPILNRLPRDHKFNLGDRIIAGLYDLLEGLIQARYAKDKVLPLQRLNSKLDILRYQTRLLLDFKLINLDISVDSRPLEEAGDLRVQQGLPGGLIVLQIAD